MVRARRLLAAAIALLAIAALAGCQGFIPSVATQRFINLNEEHTITFTVSEDNVAPNGGIISGTGAGQYDIVGQTCIRPEETPMVKNQTCTVTVRYRTIGRFRAELNIRNERSKSLDKEVTLE